MTSNIESYIASKVSQSIILDNPHRIAVLDTAPFEDGLLITRINVPVEHRGKGYGRTLLTAACQTADLLIITLYIEPRAYNGSPMNDYQLRNWYLRNGFVGNELMVRKPEQI